MIAIKNVSWRNFNSILLWPISLLLCSCLENSTATSDLSEGEIKNKAVAISIADAVVGEADYGQTYVNLEISLNKPLVDDATYYYSVYGLTASRGEDFPPQNSSFDLKAGDQKINISIAINGDLIFEKDEYLEVEIINNGNLDYENSDLIALVSIIDNDPGPSISINDAGSLENSEIEFTVSLSSPAEMDIRIQYEVDDFGDAKINEDFNGSSGLILIPAGESSGKIKVLAIKDSIDEATEAFGIEISSSNSKVIFADSSAIGSVLDNNSLPSVQFKLANQAAYEHQGTLNIEIELSEASGRDVLVPITISGTSTYSASEYSAPSGSLTIPEGSLTAVYSIELLDDLELENFENLILEIDPSISTASIGSNSMIDVKIAESDGPPTTVEKLSEKKLGFEIQGYKFNDATGERATSVGDINGDGYDDIVAFTKSRQNSIDGEDRIYFIWGQDTDGSNIYLDDTTSSRVTSLTLTGNNNFQAYYMGDINGDGIDDISIDPSGSVARILLGGSDLTGTSLDDTFSNLAAPTVRSTGPLIYIGDLDGDGYDDFSGSDKNRDFVSSGENYAQGAGIIHFGRADGHTGTYYNIGDESDSKSFTIEGDPEEDYYQLSRSGIRAAGDANNDGYDDYICYAKGNKAFLFWGGDNIAGADFNVGSYASYGVLLDMYGDSVEDPFYVRSQNGYSDYNFDGISDFFVNFGRYRPATTFIGHNSWVDMDLNGEGTPPIYTNYLTDSDFHQGHSVTGDFNADGLIDIIKIYNKGTGTEQRGSINIIWGKQYTDQIKTYLNLSWDHQIFTDQIGNYLQNVYAGDFNGDGIDDFLVQGSEMDGQQRFAGKAFVVFGGNLTDAIDYLGTDNDDTMTGTSADEVFFTGAGNDIIDGGGSSNNLGEGDVIQAGRGDDIIIVRDYNFNVIKGNHGEDTIRLIDFNLDLSTPAVRKFQGIERFDLKTSANAETLSLSNVAVRKLNKLKKLTINGNANDTLDLSSEGANWLLDSGGAVNIDGTNYYLYNHSKSIAKIYVEAGMSVDLTP